MVFAFVIPTLESRLRDEKIATVRREARAYGPGLHDSFQSGYSAKQVNGLVSDAAQQANARVTLLNVAGAGSQLIPIADSSGQVRDPSPLSSPNEIESSRSADSCEEMVAATAESDAPSCSSSRLRLKR